MEALVAEIQKNISKTNFRDDDLGAGKIELLHVKRTEVYFHEEGVHFYFVFYAGSIGYVHICTARVDLQSFDGQPGEVYVGVTQSIIKIE